MDTKQPQREPQVGRGGGGFNCLVVFITHFNPNNSLLILLEISLLFMCSPAISAKVQSFE